MTDMTADPRAVVVLFVALQAGCVVAAIAVSAIVHDDWRPDWRRAARRTSNFVLAVLFIAVASDGQNALAQAQQDSTVRRVERLEDYRSTSIETTSKLETIASQQKDMLAQLIAGNAAQDQRISENTKTLQSIATAAETIHETQEKFTNRVTWVGGILTTIIIMAGFLLDRVRESRMRNGHNPITAPIADLEKKMSAGREETNKLLKEMIEVQSRRRTR